MNRKKILFFIESLAFGGAEKSLVTLLRTYDFAQWDVTLCMLVNAGGFTSVVPAFVKVYYIAPKALSLYARAKYFVKRKWTGGHLHDAQHFWQTFATQYPDVEQTFDVAVSYSQGFSTYFVAEKVKARVKLAWVNTTYDTAGYAAEFDRPFYRKFKSIIAVSEHSAAKLRSYFPDVPVTILHDITEPQEILARAQEAAPILEASSAKLISVGRLEEPKNYMLAIDTAARLAKDNIAFHWYIIGEGSQRSLLEQQIQKLGLTQQITLLGAKANPYALMKQCDIFVQTSSYEGWGLTVVEAKILGKPVVVTNFPTAAEIITDGVTGYICEMRAESLAERIIQLITDVNLRCQLSSDNITEVLQRKENTLKKFFAMIQKNS